MSLAALRSDTTRGGVGETGVLFAAIALGLTGFGVLMIFSASSIMALTSADYGYNPGYFAIHQLIYALAGIVGACIVALFDYHVWTRTFRWPIWLATVFMLAIIFTPMAGADAYGATRWIALGPVHLQPSEFAKATILLVAADLFMQYYEEGGLTVDQLSVRAAVLILLPIFLVLKQPDKGSVLIIGMTVILMLFMAGLPIRFSLILVGIGVTVILALAFRDEYSRARIMMMGNPWLDEYGDGYQLVQGYYAFGSGGLFGVGLGMSRQKYSYLPMAHNDFILAVIGEELGFVGLTVMLAFFFALVWLGFKISREAPDLSGRLLAAGAVTMLSIQLMVNACGVLGIIPLSGKPVPFISYGGSSIMGTLILVGLVLSVAHASQAPSTRASHDFSVVEGNTSGRFRVIQGGASRTPEAIRSSHDLAANLGGRVSYNANGTRRVDLGPSASDRLRGRRG